MSEENDMNITKVGDIAQRLREKEIALTKSTRFIAGELLGILEKLSGGFKLESRDFGGRYAVLESPCSEVQAFCVEVIEYDDDGHEMGTRVVPLDEDVADFEARMMFANDLERGLLQAIHIQLTNRDLQAGEHAERLERIAAVAVK